MDYITLRNGVKMPQLGYGVFKVENEECERCVLDALSVGYRSIDTAHAYHNEEGVGNAIHRSGIPREEIFLTTKVGPESYGEAPARHSLEESFEKLQTDYLDLVLLHQPYGDTYGAWRVLESLYEAGRIRAIGISNFQTDRMVEFANLNRICPMVNQLETHPYHQQTKTIKWLKRYDIQLEAWAPFGEGRGGLFTHPVLTAIGEKYGKSTAQVMLRWNLQRGVVVIPKSTHIERMQANIDVFDFALNQEDMLAIAALDGQHPAITDHADPEWVEFFTKMMAERAGIAS